MLRHISALAVGHLRGARWFCSTWRVMSMWSTLTSVRARYRC